MPTFAVIRKIHVVCASNTTVRVLSDLWIWDPLLSSFNQNQADRLFARKKKTVMSKFDKVGRKAALRSPTLQVALNLFLRKAIFKVSNFKVASKVEVKSCQYEVIRNERKEGLSKQGGSKCSLGHTGTGSYSTM